jgi:hypothetical protein
MQQEAQVAPHHVVRLVRVLAGFLDRGEVTLLRLPLAEKIGSMRAISANFGTDPRASSATAHRRDNGRYHFRRKYIDALSNQLRLKRPPSGPRIQVIAPFSAGS